MFDTLLVYNTYNHSIFQVMMTESLGYNEKGTLGGHGRAWLLSLDWQPRCRVAAPVT